MAQSPPAWNIQVPPTPQQTSPLHLAQEAQIPDISASIHPRHSSTIPAPTSTSPSKDAYVSKIGILASSIPYYHNQFMEHKKKVERERHARVSSSKGEEMSPDEVAYFSKVGLDSGPREQSSEEQAETAKRLKPHSRSTLQLQYITSQAPEKPGALTRTPSKKNRTRWQFGIRSRNLPHEAMHCVYKALAAQNADWEVPMPPTAAPGLTPSTYPVHVAGATRLTETMSHGSSSTDEGRHAVPGDDKYPPVDYTDDFDRSGNPRPNVTSPTPATHEQENDDDVDPSIIPEGYIPKDPWCIKVRWRKDGMYPPGTIHPHSAHSSRLDLSSEETRRRNSIIGSLSSAAASTTSVGAGTSLNTEGACYVYMDVQLYTLEPGSDKQSGTFLVDFKCAGYESVVEATVNDTEKVLKGSGYRVLSKDVNSPQPFIDLTNKLVIHLAGGGG